MSVQHLLKTFVFGLLGFAFAPWIGFAVLMIAIGLLGTVAGNLVLSRISDARFHQILNIMLLLISIRLVWSGLASAF